MTAQFPGDKPEVTIEKQRRLASDLSRIRARRGPTAAENETAPILDGWTPGVRPVPCWIAGSADMESSASAAQSLPANSSRSIPYAAGRELTCDSTRSDRRRSCGAV